MTKTIPNHTGNFRTFLKVAALASFAVALLASCHMEFGSKPYTSFNDITIPAGFTFSSEREITFNLTVTYKADGLIKNYDGTVSIITQAESGDTVLGSGLIVNGTGSFGVVIPTSVTHVAIRPDRMIMVGAEADIDTGTTQITRVLAPAADRAVIRSAGELFSSRGALAKIDFGTTKTGFKTLSHTYDSNGMPTDTPENGGLEKARFDFTENFLTNIGLSFPESQKVPITRPEYIEKGKLSSVVVMENAEVAVTFVSEGAGYKNSLAYYVTKTGDEVKTPKASDIVIIFPNASASYSGGGLNGGDTIKLRNPIDGENFATTLFSAGYTIHWVLVSNGFQSGTVSSSATRYYSEPELNPEYKGTASESAHSALLFYTDEHYNDFEDRTADTEDDAKLVLGIEDMGRKGGSNAGDEDFNDCLFVVTATPFKNIDTSGLPKPHIDPETTVTEYFPAKVSGTMIYEDLWPSKGDYDFNDMVIEFRMQTVRTGKGYANSYRGDFDMTAAGASILSGLGFVLPVNPKYIEKVEYEHMTPDGAVFKLEGNMFEDHGDYAVIPVMDYSVKRFDSTIANTRMDQPTLPTVKVAVKITFAKDSVLASDITGKTPDIFLVDSNDRSKEVHIIGKKPTSLAIGDSRFNTADDNSEPPLYYKDKQGAPWALMIPAPFSHTVEKVELPAGYLHFGDWVVSGGLKYTDWYDASKDGYADKSKLYVPHP